MMTRLINWVRKRGIAVYGNWCGPGHSGPSAPVDDFDGFCMSHDLCYDNEGPTPRCDAVLVFNITKALNNNVICGFKARMTARFVRAAFLLRPGVRKVLDTME